VGWGSKSLFQQVMVFFLTYPLNWSELAVNVSLVFLPLNILFWSAIVFVITYLISRALKRAVNSDVK
jgi:hypothetical protein